MTVRELYIWAKERGLLDIQLSKHLGFAVVDVVGATYLAEDCKVVVD